ncbi:MAG: hypothetical protein TREMPRED_002013 [Tremellales sp. Tagirdzhanova-0007]|nr:MAG: hypothetical protein TREMPRED_002013 [Tremellales sp. Tagirdzhanova-0007]
MSHAPDSPSANEIDHKITYTDSAADVTLVSTEGRHFKVYSEPVKFHATSELLKVPLDLMHQRRPPGQLIWSCRASLLKLCDELGCPGVAERALFAMHKCVEKDPWSVFCLASQRAHVADVSPSPLSVPWRIRVIPLTRKSTSSPRTSRRMSPSRNSLVSSNAALFHSKHGEVDSDDGWSPTAYELEGDRRQLQPSHGLIRRPKATRELPLSS